MNPRIRILYKTHLVKSKLLYQAYCIKWKICYLWTVYFHNDININMIFVCHKENKRFIYLFSNSNLKNH